MASTGTSPSAHFLSGKKIIISGAGIGGLSFAIALRKQWTTLTTATTTNSVPPPPPKITIYERETQANAIGREGYSMSIRSDSPGGVQALQRLGVLDAMLRVSVSAADASQAAGFCMWDGEGKLLFKMRAKVPEGLPVGSLRIARDKLRGEMLKGAEAVGCKVTWDAGCVGVERREDGRLDVQLMNGQTDDCDLLVVADGATSKMRAQLRPDDELVPTGIAMIGGASRFGAGRPPSPVDCNWGMVLNGTGYSLFASPVDKHSAVWAVSFHTKELRDEQKKKPLPAQETASLLAEARSYAHMFPPWFGVLVDASDPREIGLFNTRDKQPFAHEDRRYPDVIFIGDANHAVTPFAGAGANMALCDGWDLATLLCSSSSLAEAMKRYDAMVIPRSKQVLKASHRNIDMAHATGWKAWFLQIMFRIMLYWFFSDKVTVTKDESISESTTEST